ncbi:murein biosynthesis integral membrane protein MurJ [Desulfovibrio legallii]|mgnify:FL=1|uniref:murein biosynthesis integral membrane protein MurJ n=1 Tax=Desulfovibrio legallii TaxID=571438 RepID=UPI0022E0F5AA|nr:lipid II flippase MurJ [Desulfovibrio legallii]
MRPVTEKPHAPTAPEAPAAQLARTAARLGGYALASRLLGLLRDMCMAWLVGSGPTADALAAALRLPHALRRLLGEGSLSMSLTAALVRHCRPDTAAGRSYLAQVGRALAVRLGAALALLLLLAVAAAPWLATGLAPGFAGPERELAIFLLRLCLPYGLAACMAALGTALLHSLGLFRLPGLSPVLFNVVALAFAGAAALGLCPPAPALALGMSCAGLAQWALLWWGARRALRRPGPTGASLGGAAAALSETVVAAAARSAPAPAPVSAAGAAAWRCLAGTPAGLLGACAPQFCLLAAAALASGLGAGLVAGLYYAERLLEVPLGLVGACLGTASLPALSRLAAQGRQADFAAALRTALRLTLLLSLPAVAGLWAVGAPLVRALFCHGAFDAQAAQTAWLMLTGFLPALPALACNRSLLAACNALGQERRTALSALAAVASTLAVGAALVHSRGAGLLPLAFVPPLAAGVGLWLQTGFLLRALAVALGRAGAANAGAVAVSACLPGWAAVLRHGLAALVTGLAARGLVLLTEGWPPGSGLAVAVSGGAVAWVMGLLLLRDGDMLALAAHLRGRGVLDSVRETRGTAPRR